MVSSAVIHTPRQLLEQSTHRPFPLPQNKPWVMAQTWERLLFAHYRVSVDVIRPMIPPQLEIDTYEGEAWISIVPFMMNHVHLHGIPAFPTTGKFPELNVRTYVKFQGKVGVWFFSLDAASWLAVWVARLTYHLPYYFARMKLTENGETITYSSERIHRNSPSAAFKATYRPIAPIKDYAKGSLDRWLSDRYVLYAGDNQRVFIGHITHVPWGLQPAEANFEQNDMAHVAGIPLLDATPPLLHYVHQLDVIAWAIEAVR